MPDDPQSHCLPFAHFKIRFFEGHPLLWGISHIRKILAMSLNGDPFKTVKKRIAFLAKSVSDSPVHEEHGTLTDFAIGFAVTGAFLVHGAAGYQTPKRHKA